MLDDVSLELAAGEVHALLGENGAGKSTLMNVLAGIYAADAGEIRLEARAGPHSPACRCHRPWHRHGSPALPPGGRLHGVREPAACRRRAGQGSRRPRWRRTQLRELGERIGLAVRPDTPIRDLSIAERQRVEILKVLVVGARILILDEPTAVLTDQEAEGLLALVRTLAGQGLAIVLITHKLREVIAAGDRVSVMRKGRITLAGVPAAASTGQCCAQAMMGESPPPVARAARRPGAVRLAVRRARRATGGRLAGGRRGEPVLAGRRDRRRGRGRRQRSTGAGRRAGGPVACRAWRDPARRARTSPVPGSGPAAGWACAMSRPTGPGWRWSATCR